PAAPAARLAHVRARAAARGAATVARLGRPPAAARVAAYWSSMIDTAMILAAGRGERMRPLTDKMPKPLIPIGGMPMLEHTLARLKAHGVVNIVVNAHHFAEQIVDCVKGRAQVIAEDRLLDTGGSVKNAPALLGNS